MYYCYINAKDVIIFCLVQCTRMAHGKFVRKLFMFKMAMYVTYQQYLCVHIILMFFFF